MAKLCTRLRLYKAPDDYLEFIVGDSVTGEGKIALIELNDGNATVTYTNGSRAFFTGFPYYSAYFPK